MSVAGLVTGPHDDPAGGGAGAAVTPTAKRPTCVPLLVENVSCVLCGDPALTVTATGLNVAEMSLGTPELDMLTVCGPPPPLTPTLKVLESPLMTVILASLLNDSGQDGHVLICRQSFPVVEQRAHPGAEHVQAPPPDGHA